MHLPPGLVRLGWLVGIWHMQVLFGVFIIPALLKKVLSAGECGVKPRGDPALPAVLFHQHVCSLKHCIKYPTAVPSLLDVVSHQYTVGSGATPRR